MVSELLGIECSHPGCVEGYCSCVAGLRAFGTIGDRDVAGRFDLDLIRLASSLLRQRAEPTYRLREPAERDHRRQPSVSMTRGELDALRIERCYPYRDVLSLRFEAQLEPAPKFEQLSIVVERSADEQHVDDL